MHGRCSYGRALPLRGKRRRYNAFDLIEHYDAMKAAVPKCKNWHELKKELQKQGITTSFKYNGNTNGIQGVMFEKNGYTFNGSKIDRQFSYSKVDFQLKQNSKEQEINIQSSKPDYSHNQPSVLENTVSVLGGLFDIPSSSGTNYDPDEAEFQRQLKRKKKKQRIPHL
jgi:hypothetical protein